MPIVFLCAFLCSTFTHVKAASLFGKVIEVQSGDVITIVNLNRPVRVRLLGVDAPEMDQAFGDVAKKHLAYLVYDNSVLVEYAGIAGDHSLNGRVLLDGADIGAQMIRDGAAWVDPSTRHRLSVTDREVYQQSEDAARSERRGLWQQENPLAPWEFAKAVALRTNPTVVLNSIGPARKPAPNGPVPELNNLTLMASRLAAAPAVSTRSGNLADLPGFMAPVNGGNWRVLRPAGESFSALVPEEGEMQDLPVRNGMGEGHLYRARDGRAAFVVMWITGPTMGESDVDAINMTAESFLQGLGVSINAHNPGQPTYSCKLQNDKDIAMRGFIGREFDLSSCTIPARARVFTRTVNGDRQMYLAIVLYMEQDSNIDRFITSFTITEPKPQKRTKRAK